MVLAQSITAGFSAIKSQTSLICAVIVNRIPVVALKGVPPGSRAVMMATPHKVMKAKRRHVVHQCLMRFKHDASDRSGSLRITRERHLYPFLGDLPRAEIRVPGKPPERIPVGLQKMMARPVSIRTGVCYSRDASQTLSLQSTQALWRKYRSRVPHATSRPGIQDGWKNPGTPE